LLEDRINDIASLMDSVGSDQAAIMGLSETGKVALLFAATYPERTRAVIAYGSFAGGGDDSPTYPWAPDPGQAAWLEDLQRNWGRGVLFLDEFAGSRRDDPHYREWFAKLERLSASPGAAVAVARMSMQTDVRDVLPMIRVPALVLHKRDDQAVPLEEGRYIAEHIPGAKFVELPGADHWPWIGHDDAIEEIQEIPHRDAPQRGAGPGHRDGDVRRHRRLDDARCRTRGPTMDGSARELLHARRARAAQIPRSRDR
jgi:pimeloyl-ACP methyl ester carboxylesterase